MCNKKASQVPPGGFSLPNEPLYETVESHVSAMILWPFGLG